MNDKQILINLKALDVTLSDLQRYPGAPLMPEDCEKINKPLFKKLVELGLNPYAFSTAQDGRSEYLWDTRNYIFVNELEGGLEEFIETLTEFEQDWKKHEPAYYQQTLPNCTLPFPTYADCNLVLGEHGISASGMTTRIWESIEREPECWTLLYSEALSGPYSDPATRPCE